MAKLSYEDKVEIIRLHNECGYGCTTISKKFEVAVSTIDDLIKQYNIHGECALIKHKNRSYSVEEKLQIINRIESGESINSLANEYMMSDSIIHSWLNKYKNLGYDGLKDKPKGRKPSMKKEENQIIDIDSIDPNDKDEIIRQQQIIIEQQKKEKEYLEMENEVLKKLQTLVQQRKKQQTKKKQ